MKKLARGPGLLPCETTNALFHQQRAATVHRPMKKPPRRKFSAMVLVVMVIGVVASFAALFYFFRLPSRTKTSLPRSESGTRRMAERLETIAREADPNGN